MWTNVKIRLMTVLGGIVLAECGGSRGGSPGGASANGVSAQSAAPVAAAPVARAMAGKPIISNIFTAAPCALVDNGRVYVSTNMVFRMSNDMRKTQAIGDVGEPHRI